MREQTELFPRSTGFRPDTSRREPRLWVRELRVYRHLAPGDSNLVRKVALRPGLNILWAQPKERTGPAQLHTPGVAGHGTGKTTFCRFLRHMLGEPAFGNDEQRLRLRETFPEGWIVAEVRLENESWIVARPFKIGARSMAFRHRSIETLFESEAGRGSFDDYLRALDAAFAEPLPVATFATAPVPLTWAHILQWLTRDQECRFAALADLRHATSDSSAPDMAVEDRHFLFRAVLRLIDTSEQAELEKNKRLVAQRQKAEKTAPLLRFRASSALHRLREEFPRFREDLAGAAFLAALAQGQNATADATDRELATVREPGILSQAREQLLVEKARALAAAEAVQESRDVLEWIQQQLSALRGQTTPDDLEKWIREHVAPDRYCGQPLSAAIEWHCPLVQGRLLPIEHPTTHGKPDEALLQRQLEAEEAKLSRLQAEEKACISRAQQQEKEMRAQTSEYDRVRGALAEQTALARSVANEAHRAFLDEQEAAALEASLVELDKQIRTSQELQAALREQRSAALSAFSDTFDRLARAVLGDEVSGSIRFHGRQIRPTLEHGIELTSAALETVKIICFDLAALVNVVEGRGAHPGFLMHDGPREADMDADLYQRLFLVVAELESLFGRHAPSFQYIITTTEPPPGELRRDPWLREPVLSAAEPGKKFLRQDF